jgi:hypothetical protein
MAVFNVTYTVYYPGSSTILSEGTMPVNVTSASQAEDTVKAMFHGNDVIIRYTTSG